ncbi:MAG: KEOPS complex subunit Pcc1 [Thermoplasmataceae archaeon]
MLIKIELILDREYFGDKIKALSISDDVIHARSSTMITEENDGFHVYIEASDTVAMRASLGAFARSLILSQKMFEEVK